MTFYRMFIPCVPLSLGFPSLSVPGNISFWQDKNLLQKSKNEFGLNLSNPVSAGEKKKKKLKRIKYFKSDYIFKAAFIVSKLTKN